MAKKNQKFKKYKLEEKEEIVKKFLEGESAGRLSKEYDVPRGTILTWSRKVKRVELNKGKKQGRPKKGKLTIDDYKERYEIIKKYQAFLKEQREKK